MKFARLACLVIVLIVGEQADGRAPALPDELIKAKTLCLDVRGGVRVSYFNDPAKAEKEASRLEEIASEAIKKWGRFDVEPDCDSADGVLLVSDKLSREGRHTMLGPNGMQMSYGARPLKFAIVSRRSQQTLYLSVTPDCERVSNCIKAEIKTLQKKMESKGTSPRP